MAQELVRLVAKSGKVSDTYLANGAIADLERMMAEKLGKEDAVFTPTGTLANNIAVRLLCGDKRHAIAQHESHLYRDESDAFALLSGLNLVPLGKDKTFPVYEEITAAIDEAEHGPYPIAVGAISIESPVRRMHGAYVPYAEVERVAKMAREHGIGLHLDGARLFLLSGIDGFEMKPYCALFDTVYISLYKYLGSPFGALLAGTKERMAQARELRHSYGGLIRHGWEAALPALDALPGFADRFSKARVEWEKLLAGLQAAGGFTVTRVENGSNIAFVDGSDDRMKGLPERMAKADVHVRVSKVDEKNRMLISVNESILRRPVEELIQVFAG
jgi:threonine aldolase